MQTVLSKNGYKIPLIGDFPLHSKIDPLKESEIFSKDLTDSKKILIIGLGFGYHLLDLIRKNIDFIVIEPDPQIISSFLKEKPHPQLDSIKILSGDTDEIIKQIKKIWPESEAKNILIKSHQASFKARPAIYQACAESLIQWQSQQILNLITDSSFAALWTYNALKNIQRKVHGPMIQNKKGSPAVILGSGYTLKETLPFIKKNASKIIIIAIPPVLEILKKEEIHPDLVLLVDGGYANRYYLTSIGSPLICYLSSSSTFIRNWQGEVFFLDSSLPIDHFLIPELPFIPVSGSAANTAIEIASLISNTILIAGFDFSFVKNYYHYPGNPLEKELLFQSDRLFSCEKSFLDLVYKSQTVFIPSLEGGKTRSNPSMASYYQDFCQKMGKPGKKYYLLSQKTAFFPCADFLATDFKDLPQKEIEIKPIHIRLPLKERLKELIEIYEKKEIHHPVLDFHLTKFKLKKIDFELERQQTLKKLKRALEKSI